MRLHLGYGPTDWAALPWHWQRAFTEELAIDGKLDGGDDDGDIDLSQLAEHGITVERG